MQISGRRIYNVNLYLTKVEPGSSFRFLASANAENLARVGNPDAADGITFLPPMIGPVTRFNSEGKWIVRRDLPKENRYITTRYWRWKTWGGDEHEEPIDVFRDCYPRELIAPPSIELTIKHKDGALYFVSPVLSKDGGENSSAKHVANLMLELFGKCEVVDEDIEQYTAQDITHVNWKLLPPGEHPWERLIEHIERGLRNTSIEGKTIIQDRAETIRSYNPTRMLVGSGGFSDYIAYVFDGAVILESIRRDNALYVFGDDWEHLSRLSKAEILHSNLHEDRIIHTQGWKDKLAAVLS